MALFKVIDIVDGSTIVVDGWTWGDYRGKTVKIEGYQVNGKDSDTFAKSKLQILLKDKQIELKSVVKAEKASIDGEDVIYCSVFLNDIDISQYFPELTT